MAPKSGESVAVAVSGGADSLALTLMLAEWCRENNIPLTALTIDHGLRAEAAEEARQVARWLKKHDILHKTFKWQGDKPESNIQDQARLARYRLMGQWCQANNVSKLFLAHHQGDQAETFLIRLFRGSGVAGLSAMKGMSDFPVPLPGPLIEENGGQIIICRPLLSVPKERLEATLQHLDQPWIEDPSNQNTTFTRVKVRNLLRESDIEGLNAERMAQTAARMARVQSLLQSLTAELAQDCVSYYPEGYIEVKIKPLMAAHEEITLRCLASLTRTISGGQFAPRLARLETLNDRLKGREFAGQTIGGCLISPLQDDRIMISREVAAIKDILNLEREASALWDGRFIVQNKATAGVVKKLEPADWQMLCRDNPDLKKLKIRQMVRESLPCMHFINGQLSLPDFIPGFENAGFQATFRSKF